MTEVIQKKTRVPGRFPIHPQFKHEPYWKPLGLAEQRQLVAEMVNSNKLPSFRRSGDVLVGEMLKDMVHKDGGIDNLVFPEGRTDPRVPIVREMISTSQGQMALLEKVRIDVAFGLAEIPLLYGPVFQRIAPANGFPGGMYQVDDYTLQSDVVFLQKFEGGEVEFGTLRKGSPSVGTIQTYACGFEWTEDMIEFDRTWSVEENNKAFGRAYNALLNHLHLSTITGYSYTSANQTPLNSAGATTVEDIHLTLQDAYAQTVLPGTGPRRTGSVLLASESDRFNIEAALLTPVLDSAGNPLPNVPITTIVYYDGETIPVGGDTYTYPGVTPGKCYLIFPQRKLKEMVHHDMRIDIGPADISRLVEGQQVARTRRGVFANIQESVEEVTIA